MCLCVSLLCVCVLAYCVYVGLHGVTVYMHCVECVTIIYSNRAVIALATIDAHVVINVLSTLDSILQQFMIFTIIMPVVFYNSASVRLILLR